MQKKFLSSLLLLLSLNLLIKPAWIFGIDLEVQNRVGAAQYGLYAAILSFTYIFNIILDLGLTHFNNQAIARQPAEVAKNFSKLTSLKVFLGLVYLLVAVVIGWFLGYTSHTFLLLLVLTVSQFLASFLLFLRSHLAGLHLFKTDSLMSVLDKLLMIITCSVLLFTELLPRDFTVVDFALAQLGSYLLAVLIAFVLVLQKARVFNWNFDLKDYLRNLKLSFPYALLIFLMAMYTRVDSIMLEQIKGAFEAGIYAQAFRLLDAVNQVGYLFSVLLLLCSQRCLPARKILYISPDFPSASFL
ncbi:MAG: oligosaccharide flippase family protein [Owenweeksia sp.]|nr:oligosaccharide flippase family protein [Owenweeksia sp.]